MIAGQKKIKLTIDAADKGIGVKIFACYKCPQSFSKSKTEQALTGNVKPTKRPDADNIAKIILDSLNGIAWNDDASVTTLAVTKCYTSESDHVDVMVRWFPVE